MNKKLESMLNIVASVINTKNHFFINIVEDLEETTIHEVELNQIWYSKKDSIFFEFCKDKILIVEKSRIYKIDGQNFNAHEIVYNYKGLDDFINDVKSNSTNEKIRITKYTLIKYISQLVGGCCRG